jgi:hypothetical protein
MVSSRKKALTAAAHALHEEQTNVLAVYERNREIVELPPGLETGHTNRRKRGARTDEDCINEIGELISRGIIATAATEFVGVPWSTWHAFLNDYSVFPRGASGSNSAADRSAHGREFARAGR